MIGRPLVPRAYYLETLATRPSLFSVRHDLVGSAVERWMLEKTVVRRVSCRTGRKAYDGTNAEKKLM